MKKIFLKGVFRGSVPFFSVFLLSTTYVYAYCTPDNDTCFECGTNCVAELTYTKDENNNNVGTFTVYGTGENGAGEMRSYSYTENPNRTTTAPWKGKLGDINNIVITEGVTNVGHTAFTGARNLENLTLPQSVTTIGWGAFMSSSLKTADLTYVVTIGGSAFNSASLRSVVLSDNLLTIGGNAFLGTQLTNINIPDSTTDIQQHSFAATWSKIYCNNIDGRCDKFFYGEVDTGIKDGQLVKYTKEDGYYVHDNQRYRSLQNMQNGVTVKRIYTVNEANDVAGKKNKVMIKYK